ncbi:uncharacterized protein LOC110187953 [Drosophila serrata]|uniref:uncharacterized protein LOC110187953 n=1 Tax=Drosophila serrata TaxID=7274 RepID=UPI000A1D15AC|nr:uncharacterized protein LOC110187953 [Drosophila serrata]KAH8374511.1 hypothetical protein KR200_000256 [Drosophila serrata]
MTSGPKVWSRSQRIPARDNIGAILPAAQRPDPIPQLCGEGSGTVMGWLLGWEYGRKWLERREEILEHRAMVSNFGRIPADFEWWLNQRRPAMVRKQRFRKKTGPRKVITAFNVAKELREAQNRKVMESLAKTHVN